MSDERKTILLAGKIEQILAGNERPMIMATLATVVASAIVAASGGDPARHAVWCETHTAQVKLLIDAIIAGGTGAAEVLRKARGGKSHERRRASEARSQPVQV